MPHFADRLMAACRAKGAPVCVGLDPVFERLPTPWADAATKPAGLLGFCRDVVDEVADICPIVKPQLACFERYGAEGWRAYEQLVEHAHDRGVLVLADAKRGDIGVSSAHYAAGLLARTPAADALTINAYLGSDGLDPFLKEAARQNAGLFALVRTSNPGGDALQGLELADGRTVAEAVADMIAEQGRAYVGDSGYSLLGAVVGATKPQDAARLRERMPQQLFLVPGFGAQGGTADDVRACFRGRDDGTGALITASRSVIYAYEGKPGDWKDHVRQAAIDFRDQINAILADLG